MGHLSGGMTEPDVSIEGRGAEPGRPVFIHLIPAPKAHMVTLAWAACDGLLKGKVLLASEQEQVADRRVVVGAAQHSVGGDANAARDGDRVRQEPSCRHHGVL